MKYAAAHEEQIIFRFPAGSARSQTSDIPQRYIKAIPREGEFAFDREPFPAGSAAAKLRILFSDTLKLSPERESLHLIGSRLRRRSRAKPSTHRSPGQKSAKNLDFSRMG